MPKKSKMNQEEKDHLNRLITTSEIESVIKKKNLLVNKIQDWIA